MGIEPTWPAWKAGALPLSYTRAAGKSLASPPIRPPPITRAPHGIGGQSARVGTARLELAASALGLRRSVPLSYARICGVTGENRTLVDWVTASRLNHSATVTKTNHESAVTLSHLAEY